MKTLGTTFQLDVHGCIGFSLLIMFLEIILLPSVIALSPSMYNWMLEA